MNVANLSRRAAAAKTAPPLVRKGFLVFLVCLSAVSIVLFRWSFHPDYVLFSNDGPLGITKAACRAAPGCFTGLWDDMNWVGLYNGNTSLALFSTLYLLMGPFYSAKFFAPITLLFLGAGAWFFFRHLGLSNLAAILGGLAAALCSDFFGVSCWGVGSHALCFGLNYLALAIVVSPHPLRPWVRYPLAGLAVGVGVMDAADIGAMFSVVTAVFVMFHPLLVNGHAVSALVRGGVRVAVIAAFAVFIASASLWNLIGTQIKGVVGTEQDQRTKQGQWDWATQWSMPKREALGLIAPGLFGYRMQGIGPDPGDGSYYWGAAGRDPAWDRYFASGKQGPPPRGFIRYGGGGSYVGVLVAIISLWAVFQSFRRENSVFTPTQRKFVWFWGAVVLVALLLSFGRFAPFYQLFYALPYASTIRNPTKFTHVLQWALLVVFAFGVHGLSRRYFDVSVTVTRGLVSQLQLWWKQRSPFDRKWSYGSALALGASLLAWFVYAGSRSKLAAYLQDVQFDETTANAIAGFSIRQAGWFVLLLTVGLGVFTLILSGYFNGWRARIGAVVLGLLVVADLTQVSARWVIAYNWKEKYLEAANNPVIEFLRQRPFANRVSRLPPWLTYAYRLPPQLAKEQNLVDQVYYGEWLQHLFQYYNIQSTDIIQMSRTPADYAAFEGAFQFDGTTNTLHRVARRWELMNGRYLIAAAGLADLLNSQFDPEKRRFKPLMFYEYYQTRSGGPILTRTNSTGPFALFEFTGALPRAKLYSHWQVSTNDEATLQELGRKEFDPAQTVLVTGPLPAPKAGGAANANGGTVEFVSYAPRHIVLRAKAQSPSVLLLNDKHDPNWNVIVDGNAAPLLRCNYIMRGVYLESGEHTVEFHFQPPVHALYVSLSAIATGLALLGVAVFDHKKKAGAEAAS